jgi:hypothetical protein
LLATVLEKKKSTGLNESDSENEWTQESNAVDQELAPRSLSQRLSSQPDNQSASPPASQHMLPEKNQSQFIGREVEKMFVDKKTNKKKCFKGQVESYNIFSRNFFISYEDGDSEEMNAKELEKVLI